MNMNTQHTQSRRSILFGALGLMSLAVSKITAATPVPENVEWVLAEINGKAVEAPAKGGQREATLKLDPAGKQASGVSVVNHYGGEYELKDNTLKFGPMITTRMGGSPEAMAAERDFHSMLESVTGWRITDGKLELLAGDKIVARFTEKAEAKK